MKSCDYLKLPECVTNEVPVVMNDKEMRCMTGSGRMVTKIKDKEMMLPTQQCFPATPAMANGAVYDEEKVSCIYTPQAGRPGRPNRRRKR